MGRISYVLRFSYFLSGKKVITAPTMPPTANTIDHLKLKSKTGLFPKPSIKRIQTEIIAIPCSCLFIRSPLWHPVNFANFSTVIIYSLSLGFNTPCRTARKSCRIADSANRYGFGVKRAKQNASQLGTHFFTIIRPLGNLNLERS